MYMEVDATESRIVQALQQQASAHSNRMRLISAVSLLRRGQQNQPGRPTYQQSDQATSSVLLSSAVSRNTCSPTTPVYLRSAKPSIKTAS